MLPSTKPLVTALPAFCLWKPSTALLAAVPLLPYSCIPALNVDEAYTCNVSVALVPSTVAPSELNVLPFLTVTAALAVIGAVDAN